MATSTIRSSASTPRKTIPVREIGDADLRFALREGWEDFKDMRGDIFFAGLIYTVLGLAAVLMTSSNSFIPFFLPVVAGVGLLGPLSAVGFYELARRREDGKEVHWFNFVDVRKRPSADDMAIVGFLLLTVFALWLMAAGLLYLATFGWGAPTSINGFLTSVFTTPEGWMLIVGGGIVGAVFGWIVLALSVASLPMLVDCEISAAEAVSASWRAANANKGEMIRWGIIVTGLLVLGSIPMFVGLAFVLPWLGYATWHLYTRLIDRSAITPLHD
jgi:uncharacterized membrane protein